jgi:RNA polymerase-binding transcription factor
MKFMENTRLTKDQVDNLQQRLEGWLLELRAAVLEVARQGRRLLDETALDVADRAAGSTMKEFLFRRAYERQRLLERIEDALSRIRNGTFGECQACRGLIDVKRLEAVPWAEHCVACQERRERGEFFEAAIAASGPCRGKFQRERLRFWS